MLGHCYLDSKYCFWFYAFHMALFFVLHGYTTSMKTEDYISYVKKKAKAIMIPYAFFALATMCVDYVLAITHGGAYDVFGTIMQYAVQRRYTLLWYLLCLFVADQIVFWLKKCNNDKCERWIVSSVFFFLLFFTYHYAISISLPWNTDLAILAVSFIAFGIYIRQKQLLDKAKKKPIIIIGLCIAWIVPAIINYTMYGFVDWYNNSFGNSALFLVAAVAGALLVMEASPFMKVNVLWKIGRDSILFYGLHRIIIDLSFVLYGKLKIEIIKGSFSSVVFALISVGLAIIILWPINLIIQKKCPWLIGRHKKVR